MIYLRPSRNTRGLGKSLIGGYYISDIIKHTTLDKSRFSFVIEASNGIQLNSDIKETLLEAHLFASDGSEITTSLNSLNPTWEIKKGKGWETVAEGWNYRAQERKEFHTTYRVRATELDIIVSLGEDISDNALSTALQNVIVQKEVTITSSFAILHQLNTDAFRLSIKDVLKHDLSFLSSVKGEPGKSVTVSEVTSALKADSSFLSSVKGERGLQGIQGVQGEKGDSVTATQVLQAIKQDTDFLTLAASEVANTGKFSKMNFNTLTRIGNNPYLVTLPSPNNYQIGETVEYEFAYSSICVTGDGQVKNPYGILYDSMMRPIPQGYGGIIEAPNPGSCFNNHYVFRIVQFRGIKVWLWDNYTTIKSANDIIQHSSMISNSDAQISNIRSNVSTHSGIISTLQARLTNVETSSTKKGEGFAPRFYNLGSYNGGTYTVQSTDYHLLAKTTGNGDNYPYIKFTESLPLGQELIIDMPFNNRCRLVFPSGSSFWGVSVSGTNYELQTGFRYFVTKSWTKEWGIIRIAYAQ